MTDLEHILPLWRELESAGADYVLATVVAVEGSSYRKPGARMILSQDGRRGGSVSGGCLEAEVARRCWWLTSNGPVVERYSTAEDDGDRPYGSGCGGVVYLLLERPQTAGSLLTALQQTFLARTPMAIATVLDGPAIGLRTLAGVDPEAAASSAIFETSEEARTALQDCAERAYATRRSFEQTLFLNGAPTRVWTDYRPARPGLWIFSAGDDAKPLVAMAHELGWHITVADGRSHLATRERFPLADDVRVLPIYDLPAIAPDHLPLRSTDAAVIMTHSFDQDSRVLACMLGRDEPFAYLGVLGPQRRTRELLIEAAKLLARSESSDQIDRWLTALHAPTGLDLGAETPATIALSILAEVQKALGSATGQPLAIIRGPQGVAAQCS